MSTAFRFLLQAREKLYSSGLLSSVRLNHPVISIGNLTMGGTGKTPLAIAIAERLRAGGLHPVILSRGYRRTSREILVVSSVLRSAEGAPTARLGGVRWEHVGDEPYMMALRLGNVPVVVGADRYQAGLLAERRGLGDIFILDDGFQHWRLHRDLDIVTIDPVEWAAGEALFPIGHWREPKSAVARAHFACVQEVAGAEMPALPIPSFTARTEIQGIYKEDALTPLETLRGRAIVAFAGIAKPERFFATVESLGIHPVQCVSFRDHHRYSARDIQNLGGEVRITTEKDAVRLQSLGFTDFVYLRISVNIPGFERLMSIILGRLSKL